MKQNPNPAPKTERVNLCLRRADREKLQAIAVREDRDLGYLCSWFVEWGMEQYEKLNSSLVELKDAQMVRKPARRRAEERLSLREEAQRLHDQPHGSATETRKRA